jgi:DNA repair protein RadC
MEVFNMGKRITKYDVQLIKESCKTYELDDVVCTSSFVTKNIIKTVTDIHNSAVEKFGILCLNSKHEITGIHIIHVGGITETPIDIRSIFQRALLQNAIGIILFHNHPSGTAKASNADIEATRKIKEAGNILNVKVIDHIIITSELETISMAEEGLM